MAQTTNRQYEVWMEYLAYDFNRPDRSDYYMIQVTSYVRQILNYLVSDSESFSLKDLVIKFSNSMDQDSSQEVDLNAISEEAAARWSALGFKPVITVPQPVDESHYDRD